MTLAAVALLVGVVLEVNAANTLAAGDPLIGVGQLLLGLAAVIASAASFVTVLMNNRKINDARGKAEVAAELASVSAGHSEAAATNSAEVVASIGPVNGATVKELLERLIAHDDYSHKRNHDLLGEITEVKLAVPLLITVVERLLEKLNQED